MDGSATPQQILPMLSRLNEFPLLAAKPVVVRAENMVSLGIEISRLLQRCSNLGSRALPPVEAERLLCEVLMKTVVNIGDALIKGSEGALLMLYQRTIATAENVVALFRTCAHAPCKGQLRCFAVVILRRLARQVDSIWYLEMRDSISSFSFGYMQAMISVLHPKESAENCHGKFSCNCDVALDAVTEAIRRCKEHPRKIVAVLSTRDWKGILERPFKDFRYQICFAAGAFEKLQDRAMQVLWEETNDAAAKKLVLNLGTCDGLFRNVLRTMRPSYLASIIHIEERCAVFESLIYLLGKYLDGVPRLPQEDPGLDELVESSKDNVKQCFRFIAECLRTWNQISLKTQEDRVKRLDNASRSVTQKLDDWGQLKREDLERKWSKFQAQALSRTENAEKYRIEYTKKDRKFLKTIRQKELERANIDMSRGEMCANCLTLESDLGRKLEFCGRCKQVGYCCKDCQVKHWKKAHKQQCKKVG